MRDTMKKYLGGLCALALLGLVACSGDDGADAANNGAANNAENNAANNAENNTANNAANNGEENNGESPDRNNDRPDVDTTPDPSCAGSWNVFFEGYVHDEDGQGIEGAKAQMCVRSPTNNLLCLQPVDTQAPDGFFSIVVPEQARCVAEATMRSLKPGGNVATFYCHVEGQDAVVSLEEPAVLFELDPATDLPPEGDSESARTVRFADGLEVDVVPFDFFASYATLSARRIDPAQLCFLKDQEDAPTGVYGFSPEGDITGDGFTVRIPNTDGLEAGATVDLFVLGGLSCTLANGELLEEGDWHNFGTGTVSQDGAMIVSDTGVPCLGWLGWR